MDATISLIIPAHLVNDELTRCLENIDQCNPLPNEVVIVIDGDKGQIVPPLRNLDPKTIRLPTLVGPGKARNAGAEAASGDILLFIDTDVLVAEDVCEKFLAAFASPAKPDAVFGSYDDRPTETDAISQYKNLLHHYTHQKAKADAFTFWTGCGAMLRKRFNELGGFSEAYNRPSIEDIELGYRLKKAGGTILLDKTIQATHLKKWTLANLVQTDLFRRAIPWSKLICKHGAMNNDMNIDLKSRMSVVVSGLFLLSLLFLFYSPKALFAAVIFIVLFLLLNRGLFSFFLRKRGLIFTLKTLPLHFLYYLISGLAYGWVSCECAGARLFRKEENKIIGPETRNH